MTPTSPMTAADAQLELRRRLRAYFLRVVGAMMASLVLVPVVAGGIALAAGAEDAWAVARVVRGLSLFGTMVYAWYLGLTTWRCPACDASIYLLVTSNRVFAGAARKTCPKCNVVLFAPSGSKGA